MGVTAAAAGGLMIGAMVLAGPAALAGSLDVSPDEARPGDSVTVAGGCDKQNDSFATITSDALATGRANVGSTGYVNITTKVKNVRPGKYSIRLTCNISKASATGTIRILYKRPGPHRSGWNWNWPHRWPRTGGGGTAAAAESGDVPLLGSAAYAGLGLLAGAAAIGGVTLVRSRRSRGES